MDSRYKNSGNEPAFSEETEEKRTYPDCVYPPENDEKDPVDQPFEDPGNKPKGEIPLPETEPYEKPKKKKHHPVRNLFLALFFLLLLMSAFLFGTFFILAGNTTYKPLEKINEEASWNLKKAREKGVTNILLIGTDARKKGEDSRSDSMILISICPLQGKICLTSILRDSYVTIPGYGENRINHAYQMGGARLLIETIEMNFHVRVDHYVKADFYDFMDVIDALGGVEMDITDAEVHYVNSYLSEINHLLNVDPHDGMLQTGGRYLLSGKQALAYSRIRYIGTDFGRTERQRKVISAVMNKGKQDPVSFIKALPEAFSSLETDMSRIDFGIYGMGAPLYLLFKTETDRVPMEGMWKNELTPSGQEVLGIDFEAQTKALIEKIYGN